MLLPLKVLREDGPRRNIRDLLMGSKFMVKIGKR